MNKKIASELAIGIILLIAIVLGGIFWMHDLKQAMSNSQLAESAKKQLAAKEDGNACQSHYYEGESKIRGWVAPADKNDGKGNGIIVQIKDEDVKNLPIKDTGTLANFTVRLIDPTVQVKNSLSQATEEKPATITIKGYAEICQQQPPQVSLEQATIAFKKG
jgi:hypothetical protein